MENKIEHKIGDKLSLEIIRGKEGVIPIARTDEGLVCIIDKNSRKILAIESVWECEVTEVRERMLIVNPVKMLVSSTASRLIKDEKIKQLLTPKKEKEQPKLKAQYKYQSKHGQTE